MGYNIFTNLNTLETGRNVNMNGTLMAAIITITLALIFYTIGVWSEHKARVLKPLHLAFFWIGFAMDTTGTSLMSKMAEHSAVSGIMSLHGITGMIAIVLMLIHAIWASAVLVKKNSEAAKRFHKFSLIVWAIWLVPYLIGMFMGMR